MNAASALLQSAEVHGITLWADGNQLRYKALQPVSEGMKNRIRQHKAEIIQLLCEQGTERSPQRLPVPDFCNPGCGCFCRLEFPGHTEVQACYREGGGTDWKWSRLDKMKNCPQEWKNWT